jgi:DnaK suppressor protein
MATAIRTTRTIRRASGLVFEHYRQLEELRRQQSAELGVRLRELRESSTPTDTVDVNDVEALLDNASNAGVGAAVVAITSRTLQGIETALRRLKRGKYGVCSECGAAISAARLRAMPFAERCRDCQEFADAHGFVLAG